MVVECGLQFNFALAANGRKSGRTGCLTEGSSDSALEAIATGTEIELAALIFSPRFVSRQNGERNDRKHARLREAATDQERTVLQRRITATDREIDQLVYELYDLTKDEITIVEGSIG